MTTDGLITLGSKVPVDVARTIKDARALDSRRVLEKFEIERLYFRARDISWGIVTDAQVDIVRADNIEWLHPFLRLDDCYGLSTDGLRAVAWALTEKVTSTVAPLADHCLECDREFGLGRATTLAVARHLLASRQWRVDIGLRIDPGLPLALTGVSLVPVPVPVPVPDRASA